MMGALEWILIVEAIVLVVAGICGATAYFSRPPNQDPDPFLRAMMGFWRTIAARRLVLDPVGQSSPKPADELEDEEDDRPTSPRRAPVSRELNEADALAALAHAAADDPQPATRPAGRAKPAAASPVLRGGPAPASVAVGTLSIAVIARSPTNEILGRDDHGLRVGVSGPADDALTNKLVLAMVAREFNVQPYQITLIRGHFQAAKAVRVAGLTQEQIDRHVREYPAA